MNLIEKIYKILDEEENVHKRLTSEIIFILIQTEGLNIKKNAESLNPIYPIYKSLISRT